MIEDMMLGLEPKFGCMTTEQWEQLSSLSQQITTLANVIKEKVMMNESSLIFYSDRDEQPVGELEVVEEDRSPIYDTDIEEEQLPVFDLYDDEDKYLIFDIYINDTHPPYDLIVLETTTMEAGIKAIAKIIVETSTMRIKVTTITVCFPKDAPLKGYNKSITREDTWPEWKTPVSHGEQLQHPLELMLHLACCNLGWRCSDSHHMRSCSGWPWRRHPRM